MPPFAPDYSGVASSLFELGGMIVIHDASGCTGNYLGYDEPRWMNSKSIVFCSGLRHMDAVLGNDKKLIKRMIEAAESLQPAFIALLGSPVPMVIGTDYDGIASEVEEATGIPSFGFDTKGTVFYDKGVSMGTIALLKRFAPASKRCEKQNNAINLLGLTPLDFGNSGNAEAVRALFEKSGIEIIASLSMGLSLDDLKRSPSAALNVALSYAGIEIAKYMERVYRIPYIAGVPLGDGKAMLAAVRRFLSGEKNDSGSVWETASKANAAQTSHKRILIAGEQVTACSIRNELRRISRTADIEAAYLFNSFPEYAETCDHKAVCERELMDLVNGGSYTDIVADPLVGELIKDSSVRFHGLPHVAVSSKVCWDDTKCVIGDDMTHFLFEIAEE